MADDDHPEADQNEVETIDLDHAAFDAEVGGGASAAEGAAVEPTVEEQLAAEKDRVLRLQAELQNTLTRKARELADERKYAGQSLMKDILPVLDNVDRAIEAAEKAGGGESGGLVDGFKMVRQQLVTALGQHQCEPIDAAGQAFDPAFHEAILQQPSAEHDAGAVVMVTQTGYRLHDRVIRPAQVIVSSGAPEGA
ncbi:MAG: nucleotide exchange factor GrpE [Planctomycetota bacterium]